MVSLIILDVKMQMPSNKSNDSWISPVTLRQMFHELLLILHGNNRKLWFHAAWTGADKKAISNLTEYTANLSATKQQTRHFKMEDVSINSTPPPAPPQKKLKTKKAFLTSVWFQKPVVEQNYLVFNISKERTTT